MNCRVCKNEPLEAVFESEKCPKYSHKYLAESELASDGTMRLKVGKCRACGLIQLSEDFPEEEYSADYQRNISFSKLAIAHVERFACLLYEKYGARNIVEVGCGNGLFLSAMKKMGAKTIGFEPSVAAARTARESGLAIRNEFFCPEADSRFSDYDSFAMRFVLEHVPDPVGVLREVGSRCRDGSVGLVEVPNAEQQVRGMKWFEFFREHTFYFTPQTLAHVLSLSGWELVEMHLTMGDEFITAIVKKRAGGVKEWKQGETARLLRGMLGNSRRVWAWGASGAGITLLCECGITSRDIEFIVDSDRNKWGLHASGSRIKIVSPEKLAECRPDAVIILSTAYEGEIQKALSEMGYVGKVGSVFPHPRWLGAEP